MSITATDIGACIMGAILRPDDMSELNGLNAAARPGVLLNTCRYWKAIALIIQLLVD